MSGIQFRYLAYLGPAKAPATLSFARGLNVICGASETGKSFVAESIEFMLGQENPVRDIPERAGYDRIRLTIERAAWPPLTLDRSVEGGHFMAYQTLTLDASMPVDGRTLRWQHSAARQDTLSYALLERTGLTSKVIRQNAAGKTRSLSFRDLARLCVATEEEIQSRSSPFLSGQFTTATAEYAVLKLLLTGVDDSALVSAKEASGRRDQEAGKIELLDQMVHDLQSELDEEGADEQELVAQLSHLDETISGQNETLRDVHKSLNSLLSKRGELTNEIRSRKSRVAEIEELIVRFNLLNSHYSSDLRRLEAIHESGSLFVYLDQKPCPLCGALPEAQHLSADCAGNTEAIVEAAAAEMVKIARLQRELNETVETLELERQAHDSSLIELEEAYRICESELTSIAAPAASAERASYNQLIAERGEVRFTLDKITRLKGLLSKRADFENQDSEDGQVTSSKTEISRSILDEFSRTIEQILQEWHYPNADRVFFDPSKRDLQIAGKERGSAGKGLRAITHAAAKIGLMEFCREKGLPHPGFVVLDSPLLAYWKPEGDNDDLRGTDLNARFYRYLLGMQKDSQVIIIENEHPPDFVFQEASVTVFTKNPHWGRYGFFPLNS